MFVVRFLLYCFDISNLYSLRCDNLGVSSLDEGSSLLQEEVRDSEARLTASMHLYSQRCNNLGVSSVGGAPLCSRWR
jgi:hypothetical protein